MKTASNQSQARRAPKLRMMSATFGAVLMISSLSSAALIPVQETGFALIQQIMNQISNYTQQIQAASEYGLQASRWMQQYKHLQQQLIQLQGFMTVAMPMTDDFKERPEDYGMEQCGGENIIASWSKPIKLDMDADIGKQQIEICQRIVLAQNKKYNETVKVLKTLRDRSAEFQNIEARRGAVGTSQGKLDANNNDVNRFATRVQMDLDYWQTMMTAYDAYIVALNQDQKRLAMQALNGRKKIWGTVVQGAVLKGALEALD